MKADKVSNKQTGKRVGLDERDKMNFIKFYKRVGFKNHFLESDIADMTV